MLQIVADKKESKVSKMCKGTDTDFTREKTLPHKHPVKHDSMRFNPKEAMKTK